MKKLSFPTVKLGNFIREVKEKVKSSSASQDDFTVYGVTNTDGITVTNNKVSDDLSNYTVLKENQFVYNPYRVNVGSIGLSLPGTFGAVSPAYVVFETNGQISNEFLLYYLKSSLGINLIKWYGDRGGVRSALRFSDLKKIDFPDITLEQQNKLLMKIKKLDELLYELYKNLSADKIKILRQSILQQAVEGKVTSTLIPIPPLKEQNKIVLKVHSLMQLYNALEEEIQNAKKYASQLMGSVLQEAFSVQETAKPAQVIEFHPDQTIPETELLAAARGKIREDTWEHLCKRALEIAGEES